MLLALDVSNTTIKSGVFDGDRLVAHHRLASDRARTADEYGLMLSGLVAESGVERGAIAGVSLSCVVPQLRGVFVEVARRYFRLDPLVISPESRLGVELAVDHPREVGADRIVNAHATWATYGGPSIAIAFGTATVFDCITDDGRYVGGAIAPGMVTSLESLAHRAAQLFQIELVAPPRAIGTSTVTTMQSGLVYGFAGLVEGLVARLSAELGGRPRVVATGGLAEVVAPATKVIDVVDPHLTLRGLRLLHELARA